MVWYLEQIPANKSFLSLPDMRLTGLLTIFFFISLSNFCFNQTNVKFNVRDSVSNETITGAIITEPASQNAITTDLNGQAILTISKTGNVTVTITELGYVSKNVLITLPVDSVNNVLLSPKSRELE